MNSCVFFVFDGYLTFKIFMGKAFFSSKNKAQKLSVRIVMEDTGEKLSKIYRPRFPEEELIIKEKLLESIT